MPKKILFVHQEKKLRYGAHYINEIIINKLRKKGYIVDTVYPEESISLFSHSLSGISNILFFFSLIQKRFHAKNYDIIQGTTYTVLPFLGCGVPVVSHFGSTTCGFLKNVPSNTKLACEKNSLKDIFQEIKKYLSISDRSSSIKSLSDIARIEIAVAKKSNAVIATSENVKKELIKKGILKHNIHMVHNAIEDYWFKSQSLKKVKKEANIIYLGRMGDDAFTIKLKGISRLIYIMKQFPDSKKVIIGMCSKIKGYYSLLSTIPNTSAVLSIEKIKIPPLLRFHYADIYVNPSRYEGFCLSLVEAMSQGLIPVVFPIGVAPEIIKNGHNGYIVTGVDEMTRIIKQIINNPIKRQSLAEEAIKTSRQFNANIFVDKLVEIYRELKISPKNYLHHRGI